MSLFQRLKTPFGDMADDRPAPPQNRTRAVGSLLRGRREQLGLDLDSIGGLRLYITYNVPGRNYKSMITAGTDPRGVIAARNGGP